MIMGKGKVMKHMMTLIVNFECWTFKMQKETLQMRNYTCCFYFEGWLKVCPVFFHVFAATLLKQSVLQIISTSVSSCRAASSTELFYLVSFTDTEPSTEFQHGCRCPWYRLKDGQRSDCNWTPHLKVYLKEHPAHLSQWFFTLESRFNLLH